MSQKQLTSKQELKVWEKRFKDQLRSNFDQEFSSHYQRLESHLGKLEIEMANLNNSLKEKDYEWLKWIIVIAAGVFSVIVTQVSKMSSLSSDQLILLKIAISANALGIVLGAFYLYTDVRNNKDLIRKIQIQRYSLLLENKERYKNVVHSDRLWFAEKCKPLSLLCFLGVIVIWVLFVWQMQTDVGTIAPNL